MKKDTIDKIIIQCLKNSLPPVKLYSKDSDGDYYEIKLGVVADIDSAARNLKNEINSYLSVKEAEINSKLIQVKCEAYELALTHSRPIERLKESDR